MAVFGEDDLGVIFLKITCLFLLITVYFRITGCITQRRGRLNETQIWPQRRRGHGGGENDE